MNWPTVLVIADFPKCDGQEPDCSVLFLIVIIHIFKRGCRYVFSRPALISKLEGVYRWPKWKLRLVTRKE